MALYPQIVHAPSAHTRNDADTRSPRSQTAERAGTFYLMTGDTRGHLP